MNGIYDVYDYAFTMSNSMEAQNRAEKSPGRQHFVQKNHVTEPARQ